MGKIHAKHNRVHGPSRRASAVAKTDTNYSPTHNVEQVQELAGRSLLCSGRRCYLAVGPASALTTVQLEQRRRLLCNVEHEAVLTTSFARSGGANLAARSGRPNWCRWKALDCCCPPAVKEAAREQEAEERNGRSCAALRLGVRLVSREGPDGSRTKFDRPSALPVTSFSPAPV